MAKLLKRVTAASKEVAFIHPWSVDVDQNNDHIHISAFEFKNWVLDNEYQKFIKDAKNYLNKEAIELKNILNEDLTNNKITDLEFNITEDKCFWYVVFADDPSDEDIKIIKENIEGQAADGIGEGLEQVELLKVTEEDSEDPDIDMHLSFYFKMWDSEIFNITVRF